MVAPQPLDEQMEDQKPANREESLHAALLLQFVEWCQSLDEKALQLPRNESKNQPAIFTLVLFGGQPREHTVHRQTPERQQQGEP